MNFQIKILSRNSSSLACWTFSCYKLLTNNSETAYIIFNDTDIDIIFVKHYRFHDHFSNLRRKSFFDTKVELAIAILKKIVGLNYISPIFM